MSESNVEFLNKNSRISNYSALPNEIYGMNVSSTAMILYARLLSRAQLSITNGYFDEAGRVFIVYALEDLAEEMHKGISTIKNNMNELVMAGLIEKRRCNTGRANMIFVKVPMTSLNSQKTDCLGPENEPYNSQKTDCYRARKMAANNNNNKQYKYTNYKNVEGETL